MIIITLKIEKCGSTMQYWVIILMVPKYMQKK